MTNYGAIKVKGEIIIYEIDECPKIMPRFFTLYGKEVPHISNEEELIEKHMKKILDVKKGANELSSKFNNDNRFRE